MGTGRKWFKANNENAAGKWKSWKMGKLYL